MAAISATVLLAFSTSVSAQQRLEFQFGVRAGVPLTKFLESDSSPTSVRETFERPSVTVGPTFEAVLYDRLLIQLDAMYKPVRVTTQSINLTSTSIVESRAASFEFPAIFDYCFSKRNARPYAGAGMVAAHIVTGTIESHSRAGTGGIETPFEAQFFLKNQLPAYVMNGGIEWKASRFAIRSEVRYTKWHRKSGLQVRPKQVEVSVGISVRRSSTR